MRKFTSGDGFLIQDDYPPGSATGLGQALTAPPAPQPILSWQEQFANWLGLLAAACLILSPVILLWMWGYAWQHHLYPRVTPAEPNFGPWQGVPILATTLNYALFFAFGAFVTANLSLALKPRHKLAAIVFWLSIVSVFIAMKHIVLVVH